MSINNPYQYEWGEYDEQVSDSAGVLGSLFEGYEGKNFDIQAVAQLYMDNKDSSESSFDLFASRLTVAVFSGRNSIAEASPFEIAALHSHASIFFIAWFKKIPELMVLLFVAHQNGEL